MQALVMTHHACFQVIKSRHHRKQQNSGEDQDFIGDRRKRRMNGSLKPVCSVFVIHNTLCQVGICRLIHQSQSSDKQMRNLWLRISPGLAVWCSGSGVQDRCEGCGMSHSRVRRCEIAVRNHERFAGIHSCIPHGIDLHNVRFWNRKPICDARQGIVWLDQVAGHDTIAEAGFGFGRHRRCKRRGNDRDIREEWRRCPSRGDCEIPCAKEKPDEDNGERCNTCSQHHSFRCRFLLCCERADGEGEMFLSPSSLQHRAEHRLDLFDAVRILLTVPTSIEMGCKQISLLGSQATISIKLNEFVCFFMCDLHNHLFSSRNVQRLPQPFTCSVQSGMYSSFIYR